MTRLLPRARPGALLMLSLAAAVALAACGGGGGATTGAAGSGGAGTGGTGGDGGTGGSSSGACTASSATGTLSVQFVGTPSGAGSVMIDGATAVTASGDGTMAAGPHTVEAFLVAEPGTIARTAYTPVIDVASPCVRAGETTTVTVTYTPIPTSGLLWLGASNNPTPGTLFGFSPATIGASGTTDSTIAANTFGSDGFTFDSQGNVWVTGATSGDPPVARYPAAVLGTDGDKTPDVTIDSPSFGTGVPGAKVLAFDAAGNLWVSVVAANKVVGFSPDQLAAGGSPTAAVEEAGITAPQGIAFDASGNMWVAASGADAVMRIDAAHLASSGTGADLTVTAWTPSPIIGTLSAPLGLAFDAEGNLWVNYEGIIARLTPTDQAGTGAVSVTPDVQITLGVQSLPIGLAFDEQGGVWFADSAGRFACLGPGQLTASATVAPAIVIGSSDIGSAAWFALYPAPAFTPLAHRLP